MKIYPCALCSHPMLGHPANRAMWSVPVIQRGVRSKKTFLVGCQHVMPMIEPIRSHDSADPLISRWNEEALQYAKSWLATRAFSPELVAEFWRRIGIPPPA